MTPRFLVWAAGGIVVPVTEMRKVGGKWDLEREQ